MSAEAATMRTRREPFNFTPMAVNPISSGSPHVRCTPMGRTCGGPDETKKNAHPKYITALFGHQDTVTLNVEAVPYNVEITLV